MNESIQLKGHIKITDDNGQVLYDDHNTIVSGGLAYICTMLLADPTNGGQRFGITQMAVFDAGNVERYRSDLTDQYVSGSSVVNVLYIPANQPATQPVTFTRARLYMDTAGATLLAESPTISIVKTTSLGLTLEWTILFNTP